MEKKSLEYAAYNNLCWDIENLKGNNKRFNKTIFISSFLCVTGGYLTTKLNDFSDDIISLGMKMVPLLIMVKQAFNLKKDANEKSESTYYMQLLCEKLEEKGIYINLEDFIKATQEESDSLSAILLCEEKMTLSLNDDVISYSDSDKTIDITDEVAEFCLSKKQLSEYKENKMRK